MGNVNLRDTHIMPVAHYAQHALRWPQLARETRPMMKLGDGIRAVRRQRRRTLQWLAIEVDSDVGNLSRIEKGQQWPSEVLLYKIAEALEVDVADLFMAAKARTGELELKPSNRSEAEPKWPFEQLWPIYNSLPADEKAAFVTSVRMMLGKQKREAGSKPAPATRRKQSASAGSKR